MIKQGYDGKQFALRDAAGQPVNVGDTITDFRGDVAQVQYGSAPHKPSTTGTVNGYYASVYYLQWVAV